MRTTDPIQNLMRAASQSAPQPLTLISGRPSQLPHGEVITAQVQKTAEPGIFKAEINGETVLFRGMPNAQLGREAGFIVERHGKQTTLSWLPQAAKPHHAGQQASQTGALLHGKAAGTTEHDARPWRQARLHTTPHPTMKSGNTFSARIAHIADGKAELIPLRGGTSEVGNRVGTRAAPHADKQGVREAGKHAGGAQQRLQIDAPAGFKAGDIVRARIAVDRSGHHLLEWQSSKPTTTQTTAARPTPAQQFARLEGLQLKPGELVPARVGSRLDDGMVRLHLRGIAIEVPAPPQVKPGDALMLKAGNAPGRLQVVSSHPDIGRQAAALLRQAQPGAHTPITESLATLRTLTGQLPPTPGSALAGVQQWIESTRHEAGLPLDGKRMAQLIRGSGQQLEHNLAQAATTQRDLPQHRDLKGLLLQAADQGTRSSQAHHAESAEAARRGVHRIETMQALNLLAVMQGDAMRIELPIAVGQQISNVQLSIREQAWPGDGQPDAHDDEQGCFNVLFALELSGLGRLRIDAHIAERAVQARIYSASESSRNFLQQHISRLQERLQGLGFKRIFVIAASAQPEPELNQRFDNLTTMRPSGLSSLLDMMA